MQMEFHKINVIIMKHYRKPNTIITRERFCCSRCYSIRWNGKTPFEITGFTHTWYMCIAIDKLFSHPVHVHRQVMLNERTALCGLYASFMGLKIHTNCSLYIKCLRFCSQVKLNVTADQTATCIGIHTWHTWIYLMEENTSKMYV